MRKQAIIYLLLIAGVVFNPQYAKSQDNVSYVIVDTNQNRCYDNSKEINYPEQGWEFYGQDAQYEGSEPAYIDNGDGTITDLNTGLMWSKAVDKKKVSLIEAEKIAEQMRLGGYSDWRVPNIKELYSLIDFSGYTGFSGGSMSSVPSNAVPFINTEYFDFEYGQINNGERYIDAQWLSATRYVSTTMGGQKTLFGVNFADGRIKGYGYERPGRGEKKFYARYVRGVEGYGQNQFVDNGDGTITDKATGLMWMKNDSEKAMSWKDALKYAEDLEYAGYDDWRLPNAKELQYIVDYSRCPDTTNSPAINPIFNTTSIINEAGQKDYPHFWTSTTHLDGPAPGINAAYIAFGRALGQMHGEIMDVHGAGAQRSDPKTGTPQLGRGPQGDARRVKNFVRCIRGGNIKKRLNGPKVVRTSTSFHGFQPTPQRESGGDFQARFIERLDTNNDGKVSRSEFDGPSDHFRHMDTNNDGYISKYEAPTSPPPRRR